SGRGPVLPSAGGPGRDGVQQVGILVGQSGPAVFHPVFEGVSSRQVESFQESSSIDLGCPVEISRGRRIMEFPEVALDHIRVETKILHAYEGLIRPQISPKSIE